MAGATYDPSAFNPQTLSGNSSSLTLDQVNKAFRLSPVYQQWMAAHGKPTNGLVKLTDSERNGLGKTLANNGFQLPDGWEIDQGGNIHEESHLTRNILIGAGIAAAAFGIPAIVGALGPSATAGLGGVEAGAVSGISPFVASGALAGGAGAGLGAGATAAGLGTAAFDAAGNFIGPSTVSGVAKAGSSVVENLLKYGVPTAGGIIGGIIQSNASGNAADAQQKYLQEALDYQKTQDTLDRARQTTLDKQNVDRYNTNVSTEAGRYGQFAGNIAPFVASGQAANSEAARLLGLNPSSFSASSGTQRYSGAGPSNSPYVDPIQDAGKLSPADRAKVDALLAKHNSSDNPLYWYGVNAQHGGFDATGADWNDHRISIGEGAGKGYTAPTTQPAPRPTGMNVGSPEAPQAAEPMVTIQAPTGATKQVPQSQAAAWQAKGATILQGVAA